MLLDRISIKSEAKGIVKSASVSAYLFTLLFLALSWLLNGTSDYVSLNEELVYNIYYTTGVDLSFLVLHRAFPALLVTFVSILTALLGVLLDIGYILYHLGIRRGREMPYLTLFDGFSFAGKAILLYIVQYIFIFLWSLLFVIPGIIAAYRYRFAYYNLCENPDMGVMEALNMSKAQTNGFKWQLFVLDLSFLGWQLLCALTLGILSSGSSPTSPRPTSAISSRSRPPRASAGRLTTRRRITPSAPMTPLTTRTISANNVFHRRTGRQRFRCLPEFFCPTYTKFGITCASRTRAVH